jgi:hypothetical protein
MLEILLNNFDNNSYFDKGINYYLTNEDDSNLLLLYAQSNLKKSNNIKKVSPNETFPNRKIKTPNTYPKPNYKDKTVKSKNTMTTPSESNRKESEKKSISYESYFNY